MSGNVKYHSITKKRISTIIDQAADELLQGNRSGHMEMSNKLHINVNLIQGMKGVEKYGKPLDPLTPYDWQAMAYEEATDLMEYLAADMVRRKVVVRSIRSLLKYKMNAVGCKEIEYWLDVLEGKRGHEGAASK